MELKLIIVAVLALSFFLLVNWAFKERSEKSTFKSLKLFPRWMKFVGLAWFILSLILPIIFGFYVDGKNFIGVQSANLGLLLICLSRDKHEDEMTDLIRLKSFYRTTIVGFSVIMMIDVLEIILGGESFMPSFALVGLILSI